MTDLTAAALPVSVLKPVSTPTATSTAGFDDAARRARTDKTAKDYESTFVSIMLGQMMSGGKTTTFGGGEGEEAFKSFLTDAMAKSLVKHGGIGLSHRLSSEMLRMQGLTETPQTAASAGAAS